MWNGTSSYSQLPSQLLWQLEGHQWLVGLRLTRGLQLLTKSKNPPALGELSASCITNDAKATHAWTGRWSKNCTCTSCKAAPRLAAAVQHREATSIFWERGPGSKPALSPQSRGGLTSPISHSSVLEDKAKKYWCKSESKCWLLLHFDKKVQSVLQPFCLLTSTKLNSQAQHWHKCIPLRLHTCFLLCLQLSSKKSLHCLSPPYSLPVLHFF